MDFQQKLANYADLVVRCGLNLQAGQLLNISTEAYHRDLAFLVGEAAYKLGAQFVSLDLSEPRLARSRVLASPLENMKYVPAYYQVDAKELVDSKAATLSIVGPEEPLLLADLDPKKINTARISRYQAIRYLYEEGIDKSNVHWTVIAAATPKWAQRIFPNLEPSVAEAQLWDEIFRICRVDSPNYLEQWRTHSSNLEQRAAKLTALKIKELRFTGPGTDLTVELTKAAIFKGGGETSSRGLHFEPNIPTEECFTTPDYRLTRGVATATRPFLVNGKLIRDLVLHFKDGEIVDFTAKDGAETFAEYISSDPGAKRLGEVALVGIDSPIFKSGHVFEEILFDENAACHIAVGSAYKFCLAGGDTLTEEDSASVGCNNSTVHTDIMISNEAVSVVAKTHSGGELTLLDRGKWCDI